MAKTHRRPFKAKRRLNVAHNGPLPPSVVPPGAVRVPCGVGGTAAWPPGRLAIEPWVLLLPESLLKGALINDKAVLAKLPMTPGDAGGWSFPFEAEAS